MRFFLRAGCNSIIGRNRGFTLIEVLAALLILSVMLVGIVSARGKYLRQANLAMCKQQAVYAVDKLLASWWKDANHQIEIGQSGQLINDDKMQLDWRIVPVQKVEGVPDELAMQVVRLEVVNTAQVHTQDHVVLSMELMVSDLYAGKSTNEVDQTSEQRVEQ